MFLAQKSSMTTRKISIFCNDYDDFTDCIFDANEKLFPQQKRQRCNVS